MFREVVGIVSQYFILNFLHRLEIMRVDIFLHHFGHTADNVILFQQLFKGTAIHFGNLSFTVPVSQQFDIFFLSVCHNKLLEAHGIHLLAVDFPDRKSDVLVP